MRCLLLLLIAFAIPGLAADPVATARLIYGGTWEGMVGVSGGIPSGAWTQSGATVTLGGTAATNTTNIQAAIDAAADNTYVLLPSGTYNVSSNVTVSNSFTELRGATDAHGLPATILNFTGGSGDLLGLGSYSGLDFANTGAFTSRNVSSPAAASLRGISTVTLASAPTGMTVGQPVFFVATEGGDDFYGFGSSGGGLTWTHWAKVSAISGSDITFAPAISADYLSGTVAVKYKAGEWMLRQVGMRNLKITQSAGANATGFYGVNEGWIYNCDLGQTSGSVQHTNIYGAFRCQIERNVYHDQAAYSNSAYAIKAYWCGGLLVLNNYFHDFANIMPMFNVHGSAFAYNYINALGYNTPTGWLSQIVYDHGAQQDYNLYEGNWVAASYNDNSSTARNTIFFRNRMRGYDNSASTGATDGNTNCLTQEDGYSYRTMAGNVLGENGIHTTVERLFTTGNENSTNNIYNLNTDHDDLVIRIGNYNTVDDAVPVAEAIAGGDALVTSYLFSSKPSWFGNRPWPIVITTDFTQSNTATNWPAAYRAANSGDDPPAGSGGSTSTPSRKRSKGNAGSLRALTR